MIWAKALQLLLAFAATLLGYMRERQLIEAGRADAVAKALADADSEIQEAKNARERVRADLKRDPSKLRESDEFSRD